MKIHRMNQMSATAEGSLYELVARGNKDLFFYEDSPTSTYLFDSSYEPQPSSISELRRVPPVATAEFGRTTEFIFDLVGDLMRNPSILINLPTWLPPQEAIQNRKSIVRDNGVSYGYTKAIAYFLFENIQFYQDNILLQEFSGDTLWAMSKISGTYADTPTTMDETGDHDGSTQSIQKNATPPQLRLELPIIGCQSSDDGFPQRAALKHTYRLRCKLRRLEDLVEASDKRQKPTPWNTTMTIKTSPTAPLTQFTSLPREKIAPLELRLESIQVYVNNEMQKAMQTTPLKVRFTRIFENTFTQSALDYTSVVAGGISVVNRRLDGRHPTSRLIWYFRSTADILANRLYSVATPTGRPYFTTVTLNIASQTREAPLGPIVWRDLVNYSKEESDSGLEIYTMNWTLGDMPRLRFDIKDATGAVNFTTADKPTFYIGLTNPGLPGTTTQLNVIQEGWNEFNTEQGRAELFSFN